MCPIKFYEIQIEAVRWFHWIEVARQGDGVVGGILGDVMGLGKTIDALGIITYDYFLCMKEKLYDTKPEKPTLIVTTLALIDQWQKEAVNKFKIPEDHVFKYHGAKRIREYENVTERGKEPVIMITNYETVQKDYEDQVREIQPEKLLTIM